jgi:hypothetical protein
MQRNTPQLKINLLIPPVSLLTRRRTSPIPSQSRMVALSEATGLSSRVTSRSSTNDFPILSANGSASTRTGGCAFHPSAT